MPALTHLVGATHPDQPRTNLTKPTTQDGLDQIAPSPKPAPNTPNNPEQT